MIKTDVITSGIALKKIAIGVESEVTFTMSHSVNGKTLKQDIVLFGSGDYWKAFMELDGFPTCNSPEEAAKKLGEWMFRMAEAIQECAGKFDTITLKDLKSP